MDQYTSVFDICKTNEVLKDRIKQLELDLAQSSLRAKSSEEKSNQIRKELEKKLLESNQIRKELKEKIDNLIDDNAVKVLEYFNDCSNIKKTAWAFGFELDELYHLIPEWVSQLEQRSNYNSALADGCSDGLQSADDYDECKIDVLGRKIYDEEKEHEFTKEELEAEREQKMRTPSIKTLYFFITLYDALCSTSRT